MLKIGALGVFVAALIVMGSVHSANTSWNVNSRMALVMAIVDRGTFAIDGYEGVDQDFVTMDKAEFNGHFYSDKAIGVSLLCLPVYAVMQATAHLFGFTWGLQWKIYILRIVSASIPAAFALALLWMLMVRAGAMPRRALAAVTFVFLGSLWFAYSTLAMPYSPGIAACLAAISLILYPPAGELRVSTAIAIGLLAGLAIICDFLFGPIVACIGVLFLIKGLPSSRQKVTVACASMVAGAAPVAVFALYTYLIFGRPSIPYEYEALPLFRDGMARGFMGIGWPRLGPAWFLTLHPFRGLLFWSPWVVVALIGCVLSLRHPAPRRTWGWLGLVSFVILLLLNSGYYMWWGGSAMGARLLLPIMATLPMGLAEICRRDRSPMWWHLLVVAGICSIALSLPVSLTNPQLPSEETTETLLVATVDTPLRAPQFAYLRRYYSGDWFWGPESRDRTLRVLPLVGMALAGVILRWTARAVPEDAPQNA